MYQVIVSDEYENDKGEPGPDYEGSIGFSVKTENIKDIKVAMFLLEITIYRIEKDNKPIYESDLFSAITKRRWKGEFKR